MLKGEPISLSPTQNKMQKQGVELNLPSLYGAEECNEQAAIT